MLCISDHARKSMIFDMPPVFDWWFLTSGNSIKKSLTIYTTLLIKTAKRGDRMNSRLNARVVLISLLFIALISSLFYKPSITGHVPVKIYTQNLSLVINESQNFLLTSDNTEPFFVASFKISGNIAGNGKVKIYIDSGRGQKLLVYKNTAGEEEDKGKLFSITSITGGAIEASETESENKNDKWFIIKPIKPLLEKEVFDEIGANEQLVNGDFKWECRETCFMSMEMSRNLAYRLVFLVEKGTILKIEEILFQA